MRSATPREKYVGQLFGLDDLELASVRAELDKQELSFMAVSPAEGRMLQFLVRAFRVRSIVEVGTLFGYSSLCIAKALPADGRLITLEKEPDRHAIAKDLFARSEAGRKIEALCGDAIEILRQLESRGPFDMVFIDANKGGYVEYLNWAEKNVAPGGLIVGDNTFLFGALWGESEDRDVGPAQIRIMNEFNSRLADPARYNSIMIPTHQGMTVAQKL